MLHGDVTFDQSHGDVFPCPAHNCEKTKHNIKKCSVSRTSPDCLPLQNLTQAVPLGGTTAMNTFL